MGVAPAVREKGSKSNGPARPITSRQVPIDDPLPYLLTNPRALETTTLNDGVWANVRDVKACFAERTYIPQILSGLKTTWKHMVAPTITLQYPEERPDIPKGYRGVPTLVRDPHGREKCVSCQLCEFVCPPKRTETARAESKAMACPSRGEGPSVATVRQREPLYSRLVSLDGCRSMT